MIIEIAIPVFNRESELGVLLSSIFETAQTVLASGSEIEIRILVSDNHSTDNSAQVAEKILSAQEHVPWRLLRQNDQLSFPAHIKKLWEAADADYIWLMGSDDALITSASVALIEKLEYLFGAKEMDLLILARMKADANLNYPQKDSYFRTDGNEILLFKIETDQGRREYFAKAVSIDAIGCFMSSVILSKKAVIETQRHTRDKTFASNIFPHVYLIWAGVQSGSISSIAYSDSPAVTWRGGNSSFTANEIGKISDLIYLGHILFPPSSRSAFLSLIQRHYGERFFRALVDLRLTGQGSPVPPKPLRIRYRPEKRRGMFSSIRRIFHNWA